MSDEHTLEAMPFVLIAEDQDVAQLGMVSLLSNKPVSLCMPLVTRGPELLPRLQTDRPDVLLLDVNMPQFSLLAALQDIVKLKLPVKIILVTALISSDALLAARDLGISGCVLKSESLVKLLPDAIQQVHAGRSYYSPEALKLLASEESDSTPLPFMTDTQRRAAAELLSGVKPAAIGTALGISRSRGYEILGELLSLFELPEGDYHNLTLKLVDHRKELMA